MKKENENTKETRKTAMLYEPLLCTGDCKIINGKFSWIMKVDGKVITFNGSSNADYFAALYKKLGYNVEIDNGEWTR